MTACNDPTRQKLYVHYTFELVAIFSNIRMFRDGLLNSSCFKWTSK